MSTPKGESKVNYRHSRDAVNHVCRVLKYEAGATGLTAVEGKSAESRDTIAPEGVIKKIAT